MARIGWGSFALGAGVGATAATVALLFITLGPSGGIETDAPSSDADLGADPTAARTRSRALPRSGPNATTGASQQATTDAAADGKSLGERRLVEWLTDRLTEAYREEALPDIIGADQGAETATEIWDYYFEDYPLEDAREQVADAFTTDPEQLGLEPPWDAALEYDCDEAPCVATVKVTTEGEEDSAACRAQLEILLVSLRERVGEFGVEEITNSGGKSRCSAGLMAWTPEAKRREQAIEEGIQGFIKAYSGEADRRLAELAQEEPAD